MKVSWRLADLLSSVDDVLGQSEAVDARPAGDRVVTRWRVSHLHGTELQKGFTQSHPAEQQVSERNKHMNIQTEAETKRLTDNHNFFHSASLIFTE